MTTSPAPWRIENGFGPIAIEDAEGRRVADLAFARDAVNARLIRAAPELLQVLENIALAHVASPHAVAHHIDEAMGLLSELTGNPVYVPRS